uniref:Uncharacterized protein n=1 Tax=Myoviridae sp. ct4vg1 TaxID=2825033 RepID=A0A8S5Q3A5_9CAUD|nr:MAG TPA: hypothetical protein [Myoviridae sp. ct4vg1]
MMSRVFNSRKWAKLLTFFSLNPPQFPLIK